MKKTENINLGGQAFTIDQDAFRYLEKYISSISRRLKRGRISEDVLIDIEDRIAELIHERLAGRTIISFADVQAVQKIMGDPQVFAQDHDQIHDIPEEKARYEYSNQRKKKRLFRNPDDKILGGVASGVAAYFGVSEPWIMRILFLFAFLSLGVGFIFYIVLWAIVPSAITDADYREMRGEPVHFDDIANSVKSEFDSLKKSFSE